MSKKKLSELISPTPKQKKFLDTVKKNKYTLYGGAKGGGKSYILRWGLVYLMIKWAKNGHKGVHTALFCEDYPSLKDRQVQKIAHEFPDWLGELTESNKFGLVFKLEERFGGGVMMLRNLDDPSKYDSAEFAAAAVDELTKNEESVFDTLRSIIRWKGIDDVKFMAGTNPGGVGHEWVKRKWIDKDFKNEPEPEEFAYVHAKAKDNPYLSDQYVKSLEGLPEQKRKALLEGSWDVFEGQFFSEWRESIHTCKSFAIPKEWKKFRAIDYGRTAPFVCLWFAKKPDKKEFYCYREYKKAGENADKNFLTAAELSEGERYEFTVLDSQCWASTRNGSFNQGRGDTIADEAYRNGVDDAIPSAKNRKAGWNFVHQMFDWRSFNEESGKFEKYEPKLQFFKDECEYIIKTLPSLTHDDNDPDDLNTDGPDHAADALSYFLQELNKNEEYDTIDKQEENQKSGYGNISNKIQQAKEGSRTAKRENMMSKTFL